MRDRDRKDADRLVRAVWRRISRCVDRGDRDAFAGPSALAETAALMRVTAPGDLGDAARQHRLVETLGWACWCLYRVAPVERLPYLQLALVYFETAVRLGGTRLPEPLRSGFAAGAGHAANLWGDRAHATLTGTAEPDGPALDEAVELLRLAIAYAPDHDNPTYAGDLANLGAALSLRHHRRGHPGDLREAIAVLERVAARDDADLPSVLTNLFHAQLRSVRLNGGTTRYALADTAQRLVDSTAPDAPERPERLIYLATSLGRAAERTGRVEDLERAIAAGREAIGLSEHRPELRPAAYGATAGLLQDRFESTGDRAHLDEAVELLRAAGHMPPAPGLDVQGLLRALATLLADRYRDGRASADLDEATRLAHRLMAEAPPGGEDAREARTLMARVLAFRFEHTGELDSLLEAVRLMREATGVAHSTPADHGQLAVVLRKLHERTGSPEALREAIAAHRTAMAMAPQDEHRASSSSNLAFALRNEFELSGDRQSLDEAIKVAGDAVEATPGDTVERVDHLVNLATALQTRYQHFGDSADLERAVDLYRRSLTGPLPGTDQQVTCLLNLAQALLDRHAARRSDEDLATAVALTERAAGLLPDGHPRVPAALAGQALALAARASGPDLRRAIGLLERAVDGLPDDDPMRSFLLSNLGRFLRDRFSEAGDQADLRRAVEVSEAGLAHTPPESPFHSQLLLNLGSAHADLFGQSGASASADRALDCWRRAALSATAATSVRMTCAIAWARMSARLSPGSPGTIEAFGTAIELLPVLTWPGLPRDDQERMLRPTMLLAGDAAGAALDAGDAGLAVAFLDQGCSVLWSHLLATRSDLSELRERDPALAARLDAVRHRLSGSEPATGGGLP
ncbi:hypothetical protein [Nonomuraea sp. NPDC049607]|uniref:tetratricopeptide repeat protein n=1 Tax=Nonomuraea sp. NPDC049607 TaxID=3154732 RepID=UPI00341F7787